MITLADRKQQILETAEELFSEKGFKGTSIRALSRKANVNLAMISYYFGSKEKLFEALVENRASFLRERLEGLNRNSSLDPLQKIDFVIDSYVDRICLQPRFHKIIHFELALENRLDLQERIGNIFLKNVKELRKIVHEGQRKNVFRKVDSDLLIATMVGTLNQVIQKSYLIPKLMNVHGSCDLQTNEKLRNRVKEYLKELFRSYLLLRPEKTKK